MNYGLYLSASALRVQEQRQEVIANNLANVNTPSFKRDLTVVRSRQSAPDERNVPWYMTVPVLDDVRGGLRNGGTHTDFSQAALLQTGQDLDVALQGEGFFSIEVDDQTQYTRDGRFAREPGTDYLITAAGRQRVLDETGEPIYLPAGEVNITTRGTIFVNGERTAQLAVTRFTNPRDLRKVGQNAYSASPSAAKQPAGALVRQKSVETSGVEPTKTLVRMLTAQRTYEASAKMIQFADSMLGRAVNDIARIV